MLDLITATSLLNELKGKDPLAVLNIFSSFFLQKPFNPSEISIHSYFKQIFPFIDPDKVRPEIQPIAQKLSKLFCGAFDEITGLPSDDQKLFWLTIGLSSHLYPTPESTNASLFLLKKLLGLDKLPEEPVAEAMWNKAQTTFDEIILKLKKKITLNKPEHAVVHSAQFFNELIAQGKAHSNTLREKERETTDRFYRESLIKPLIPKIIQEIEKAYSATHPNQLTSLSSRVHKTLASLLNDAVEQPSQLQFIKHFNQQSRSKFLLGLQQRIQSRIHQSNFLVFMNRELTILLNNWKLNNPEIQEVLSGYLEKIHGDMQSKEPFTCYPNEYLLPKLALPEFSKPPSPEASLILNRIQAFQQMYQAQTLKELLTTYKEMKEKKGVYASLFEERGFFALFGKYGATKTSQRCLHEIKNRILDQIIYYGDNQDLSFLGQAKQILANHENRFFCHVGKTSSEKASEKLQQEWIQSTRPFY